MLNLNSQGYDTFLGQFWIIHQLLIMGGGKALSHEEILSIMEYFGQNLTITEISRRTNRSRSAIKSFLENPEKYELRYKRKIMKAKASKSKFPPSTRKALGKYLPSALKSEREYSPGTLGSQGDELSSSACHEGFDGKDEAASGSSTDGDGSLSEAEIMWPRAGLLFFKLPKMPRIVRKGVKTKVELQE